MRRPTAAAVVFLLVVSGLALSFFVMPRAVADPTQIDNRNGTSDAVWNFTNAADYTLSNTRVGSGQATLRPQTPWWNSTTAADFAGPDGTTNVDLTTWPGDVVLATTGGAATLVTIQPDPIAGLDSYLDRANPTTNHGSDTTMIVDPQGSNTRRPILQFNLAAIPAGAVVDDAKLSLYTSASGANPTTTEVHAVTPIWDEAQVTWNQRLTGTPWATGGGDYDAHVIDLITLNTVLGWKTWNVTQVVDLWYRGRLTNHGLILVPLGGGAGFDKTFWSSDYAVDPTLRPKIDVRYRLLGATGEYISKVGGPGSLARWRSISWNFSERSFVTDEFNGGSLNPKWTWINPPTSYDVGTTTPGSLHVVSSTGVDLNGATFTGNVLANEVVGNFTAVAKISGNPTAGGQKMGLMVLLNNRNWYAVQKGNVAGAVNWQAIATSDAVSTIRTNVGSGNPIPAWFRVTRSGTIFTAATSTDGSTWTTQDTFTPAAEYPLEVRVAIFVADGLSGAAQTIDVDYVRVTISNDATVSATTRLGNTRPVDASWTGWSAPYPASAGSAMTGISRYTEFRLSFTVTYPDHTPDVGDVNISWDNYAASGRVETKDLVPGDVSQWGNFTVVQTLNGQTASYSYSTDSGGSWTAIAPPASLQSVSTASGKIRVRADLATSNETVTPVIREMRLGYRHLLNHFYVTASPTATAGASFTVMIAAKDAGNSTMTWWTGAVNLAARLSDGITPGGGTLGTTSVTLTSGGTATLTVETYTKAEIVRIRASAGSASGLGGLVDISSGPLDHLIVTPGDVTILPFDSHVLSVQGYDRWNNTIAGLPYAWSISGGVGSLNATTGRSVNFTASPPPANGTVQVSVGAVTGMARIHVVTGVLPWVAISVPSNGAHVMGVVTIRYTHSADAVSIQFDYNAGSGWILIGTTATLNGSFLWDTSRLNFFIGTLRATVTNSRTISNTTVVSPIEVGNAPPVLATIPDLTIEAGTTYVLDLAPYISDRDTPLSALTVTTDSPYVTVTGHNLTLAFPSAWRNAAFNVTVSDGMLVAKGPVRVAFHVTPLWWQAPYVLALPPIGVFAVLAVFAQRARWRPGKAFLVDERGRMLREFTLDPSCTVTYEQAVQAGVLDAVEKPIKVMKYHGQTVRGEALAVVLLAYGPVTSEQVEFAREMLVQVQDKFEEAVKQRLEDARTLEANLEARTKSIEEQTTAMEIRASEIGSMLRQANAAQAKIDLDSAALEAKDKDLKSREMEVAESRRATEDLAKELEEKRSSLDQRKVEIESQVVSLDARVEATREREDAAAAFAVELERRDGIATNEETRLKDEAQRLAMEASSVSVRLEEIVRREADAGQRETTLAAERQKFEADQKELLEFKRSIDQRVTEVEGAETSVSERAKDLTAREARIVPAETELARREALIAQQEDDLSGRKALMDAARKELSERTNDLEGREAALARGNDAIEISRQELEAERRTIEEMQQKADRTFQAAKELEAATLAKSRDLEEREIRIPPAERQLEEKTKQLDARESDLTSRADEIAAKALALDKATSDLSNRETSLGEDRVVLREAQAAFESDRREFQERTAQVEEQFRRRRGDLDAQAKGLGENQLRLAQEKESFEASHTEKNQTILSREIELEAREQSLREKEEAVGAQAEENARRFTETAVREESLEIEGAKLDKARAELEMRKNGLADLTKELDGKAVRLREEEVRRAEELRTWQATLESEQSLLKQQRETFEQETSDMRASWEDRVMRLERREVDLEAKEEEVRGDAERIARTDEELKRREAAADDAGRIASQLKGEAERVQREGEARLLEIESRERALREEAARHAIELTKQTESLKALEAETTAKRSEFEQLQTAQTAQLHQREMDLQKNVQALEAKGREWSERESRLAAAEETLSQGEVRLQREHEDVQATAKQLESRELELAQLKDRNESEAARIRNEGEGVRQSVATKEAELRAERERIERDSSALQETLGAKAKEMALREKALAAREAELRAEEQDLEARGRELDSKEHQSEARVTELSAQAMALIRREQDLNARAEQLDQTVRRFETEAAEKRREGEALQASLRSQQSQFTATAETRAADLAKRTQEIEEHERTQRAWFAQFEMERSKLDAQAKAQVAKSQEAEAAWQRSEARLAELKAKENELLRARQSFESERSVWSARRGEELKQLEATRDAAAQQAQQAERLVAESQRRALVAEEAERAAKRQVADLAVQHALLEKRRTEAEKAEVDAQAHIAQLQDASRKLATKDMDIATATKDLEARQSRLSVSERDAAALSAELHSRKAAVNQEAARTTALSGQLAARQRDLESRTASLEANLAQLSTKEQTLATELQRADNLMEDLTKKERELRARDDVLRASETAVAGREGALVARDTEVRDAMRSLEKVRQEVNDQRAAMEEDRRTATTSREESEARKREAERLRAQADEMQAEVTKNLRFLQKKALDVLDQEEKIRTRVTGVDEKARALDAQGEILEGKERALMDDQAELDAKTAKLQAEVDRLRARIADAEKAGAPTTAAMEEWKKDVENRVKIIQKKAMELLDREEKLRKKEEELRALASQLGVSH